MSIKMLSVVDFDGTLFDSPTPETVIDGMPAYEFYDHWLRKNGMPKRKFQGWWGRIESLTPPITGSWEPGGNLVISDRMINWELKQHVDSRYRDPETLCVLMTGRHAGMKTPGKTEHICKTILDSKQISFDRYYFLKGSMPTFEFKRLRIEEILEEHPTIEHIEIWEDRMKHVSMFYNYLKTLKKEYQVNHVKFPN